MFPQHLQGNRENTMSRELKRPFVAQEHFLVYQGVLLTAITHTHVQITYLTSLDSEIQELFQINKSKHIYKNVKCRTTSIND